MVWTVFTLDPKLWEAEGVLFDNEWTIRLNVKC